MNCEDPQMKFIPQRYAVMALYPDRQAAPLVLAGVLAGFVTRDAHPFVATCLTRVLPEIPRVMGYTEYTFACALIWSATGTISDDAALRETIGYDDVSLSF